MGEQVPDHHDTDPTLPKWFKYFGFTLDHKVIGIQYGITSIILLGYICDDLPHGAGCSWDADSCAEHL